MTTARLAPAARLAVARYLENGGRRSPSDDAIPPRPPLAARLFSSAWSAVSARGVARRLELPRGVRVIGVGGPSLGGSCKTPFAMALVEALAKRGADVALVGHAYRARPGRARVVIASDDIGEVGDDALVASRCLAASGALVIVGPSRQEAIAFASRHARYLVVDGLLQARPQRLARSILLLDGASAWGNGFCPPAGDLRAPPRALLDAADGVCVVRDDLGGDSAASSPFATDDARAEPLSTDGAERGVSLPVSIAPPPIAAHFAVTSRLDRVIFPDGRALPLAALRDTPFGLLLTVARPQRIAGALARRGLSPVRTVAFADHHHPTAAELAAAAGAPTGRPATRSTQRIEIWLTTAKCAIKLPPSLAGAPIWVLDHAVRLPNQLVDWAISDE